MSTPEIDGTITDSPCTDAGALSDAWATVEDSDELDSFRPHVVHAPHDPFPVAMCCRKPHGCEYYYLRYRH